MTKSDDQAMNDAEFKGILEMRDTVIAQLAETVNKQKAEVKWFTNLVKEIEAIVDEADPAFFDESPLANNWYERLTMKVSGGQRKNFINK